MKKLLSVILFGAGLLLLSGCVPCDEMCSVDDHSHKAPSAGLHKKNLRDCRDAKAKSEKKAAPKVKKVKTMKPKKAAPKVKKAKKVRKKTSSKAARKMKPKKVKTKKKRKMEGTKHSYGEDHLDDELLEYAPWARDQKEVVDPTLA